MLKVLEFVLFNNFLPEFHFAYIKVMIPYTRTHTFKCIHICTHTSTHAFTCSPDMHAYANTGILHAL